MEVITSLVSIVLHLHSDFYWISHYLHCRFMSTSHSITSGIGVLDVYLYSFYVNIQIGGRLSIGLLYHGNSTYNIYNLSVHVKANGWVKWVITYLTLSDSLSSEMEPAPLSLASLDVSIVARANCLVRTSGPFF